MSGFIRVVVEEARIESPRARRYRARGLGGDCRACLKRILGIAGIALLLIGSTPAKACRCQQLGILEYFTAADLVAEARIVGVSGISPDGETKTLSYRVESIQVFKGQPVAEIRSYASSASCGVDFAPGQRLWLFADQGPGAASSTALWMNTCNGTRPASAEFVDVEAVQVADTLARLARRVGTTPQQSSPRPRPSTELRRISRERIDVRARLALQRDAVVSPAGLSRAVVIDRMPDPRPPHVLRLVVENANLDVLEFLIHGRWRLKTLDWINDKLLVVVVSDSDAVIREWVLDTREAELIHPVEQ